MKNLYVIKDRNGLFMGWGHQRLSVLNDQVITATREALLQKNIQLLAKQLNEIFYVEKIR
jgi:hypothetical protein